MKNHLFYLVLKNLIFLVVFYQGILVEFLDDSDYVTKPVGSMSTRSQSSCAHRNSWKVVGPEGGAKSEIMKRLLDHVLRLRILMSVYFFRSIIQTLQPIKVLQLVVVCSNPKLQLVRFQRKKKHASSRTWRRRRSSIVGM